MAEPYVIKMPQLSDTMTEGVMVSWEKEVGDKIERGDIVATVETDKAMMDVEVFRAGFLSGPHRRRRQHRAGRPCHGLSGGERRRGAARRSPPSGTPRCATQIAHRSAEHAHHPEASMPRQRRRRPRAPGRVAHHQDAATLRHHDRRCGGELGKEARRQDRARRRSSPPVETDKAIMDVEVFREGYLSGPSRRVDAMVPVGGPLAYLVDQRRAGAGHRSSAGSGGKPAAKAAAATPSAVTPRGAQRRPAGAIAGTAPAAAPRQQAGHALCAQAGGRAARHT